MYGISFGNEKVQKWVTSLLFSILSSVFLTQPIQVALTAMFLVSVFRKATDFYQDKVKDENKVDKKAVGNNKDDADYEPKKLENGLLVSGRVVSEHSVEYIRRDRIKQRKVKEILKKLVLHSMFLWILYVTAFSNRDLNSYRYQKSLASLMAYKDNGLYSFNTRDTINQVCSLNYILFYKIKNFNNFKFIDTNN
jgi:hypothetical protein